MDNSIDIRGFFMSLTPYTTIRGEVSDAGEVLIN